MHMRSYVAEDMQRYEIVQGEDCPSFKMFIVKNMLVKLAETSVASKQDTSLKANLLSKSSSNVSTRMFHVS